MEYSKQGPKRRRYTPRDKTAVSRRGWLKGCTNFKREREARMLRILDKINTTV